MIYLRALFLASLLLALPHAFKREFKLPAPLHLPANPAWDMPAPDIFNQPFTYLAHGNQSTVFQSEDGKYVMKLFRYNRTRFPLIHKLKSLFAKKPKNDLFTKTLKTLTAAHLACTEAREFTQVIYIHLNITENELPMATLIADKVYKIPLDRYRFVIQRKAEGFAKTLLEARSDPEKMHALIHSWVELIEKRSALGIRNADPNLAPNFGFIGNEAVEIDFGNYRKAPQTDKELESYYQRFEDWLSKNAPEYKEKILTQS